MSNISNLFIRGALPDQTINLNQISDLITINELFTILCKKINMPLDTYINTFNMHNGGRILELHNTINNYAIGNNSTMILKKDEEKDEYRIDEWS